MELVPLALCHSAMNAPAYPKRSNPILLDAFNEVFESALNHNAVSR